MKHCDGIKLGDNVVTTEITELPTVELVQEKIKVDLPSLFSFEPKQGTENSIIRILGHKLNELDYICFRDIKVKILKKIRKIVNKDNNTSF